MSTGPQRRHKVRGRTGDRGSVAMAMLIIVIVTGLIVALLATAEFGLRSSRRAGDSANALQLADAGVNDAIKAITAISGYIENGQRHQLIEKVRFAPPRKN